MVNGAFAELGPSVQVALMIRKKKRSSEPAPLRKIRRPNSIFMAGMAELGSEILTEKIPFPLRDSAFPDDIR